MGVMAALVGLAAAGSLGMGIAEMVSAPKVPQPPGDTSAQQAQAAQAAALAQAESLTRRRGMAATILTSPLGVQSAPQTARATLGT